MKKSGFTLIELSIVLVIIGLLIGGVLVGQSLIESARINRQISEWKQLEVAANLYKNKFKYLPGDDPNNFRNTGATHNGGWQLGGNGDGYVFEGQGGYFGERCTFFSGMKNAGFWNKLSANACSGALNVGETVPKLFEGKSYGSYQSFYVVSAKCDMTNSCNTVVPDGKHYIVMGINSDPPYLHIGESQNITPDRAAMIDAKLDDGKPLTGNVFATGGAFNLDVNWACVDANSNYDVSRNAWGWQHLTAAHRSAGTVCSLAIQTDIVN